MFCRMLSWHGVLHLDWQRYIFRYITFFIKSVHTEYQNILTYSNTRKEISSLNYFNHDFFSSKPENENEVMKEALGRLIAKHLYIILKVTSRGNVCTYFG